MSEAPLRLLMVSHYFAERRGGVELVAAALARELAAAGFTVTWLATGEGVQSAGAAYRVRPLAATGLAERLLGIPYPLPLPSALRALREQVACSDLVLVHDALQLTSVVTARAARALGKPCVVVQHIGLVPYRNPLKRALMACANAWVAAPLLREADQVVFISEAVRQHFATLAWRRPPLVIFNGVDTRVFTPPPDTAAVAQARAALGLPEGPVALFVGRFVEKKGLAVLAQLARGRPGVTFAFAGRGPLDPARWGLANVRTYASLSGRTLAPLYQASDLLLLPSVGEGFPLVVQEALACGLPVLCGRDTASADPRASSFLEGIEVDLARPQATARLFDAAITAALTRAQPLPDRRARCDFARASYSWRASGEAYASVLRRLHAPERVSG